MAKKSVAKKIISAVLGLLFIVLVICAIVVGTYTLSSPNTDIDSKSRTLISGAWEDDEKDRKLEFFDDGTFKYSKLESEDVIADGYFKVDEDGDKIKLFMLPGHHTEEFDDAINFFFFATISFKDLDDPSKKYENKNKKIEDIDPPTCTFLIKNAKDSDGVVLNCVMPEKTLDLYSRGKKFKAKNR